MTHVHNIITWLSAVEHLIPPPEDMTQVKQWIEAAEDLADDCLFTDQEHTSATEILVMYTEQHKTRISQSITDFNASGLTQTILAHMNELCQVKHL